MVGKNQGKKSRLDSENDALVINNSSNSTGASSCGGEAEGGQAFQVRDGLPRGNKQLEESTEGELRPKQPNATTRGTKSGAGRTKKEFHFNQPAEPIKKNESSKKPGYKRGVENPCW